MSQDGHVLHLSPQYVVLFSTVEDVNKPYDPFAYEQITHDSEVTLPHGLIREVATALPGLWYCLHLPSTFYQLLDIPFSSLKMSQTLNLGHKILLCPIEAFDSKRIRRWPDDAIPTLIVCPDKLAEEAAVKSSEMEFALPVARYSTLSSDGLREHWRSIHSRFLSDYDYLGNEPDLSIRLDLAPTDLPRKYLARQLKMGVWETTEGDISPEGAVKQSLWLQLLLASLARLESEEATLEEARKEMPRVLSEEKERLEVPVTLGLPGVSPTYARKAYGKAARAREIIAAVDSDDTWSLDIPERSNALIERNAIEFSVAHQAIGNGGIGLMLPSIPAQSFVDLAQLEKHFMGKPDGRVVWKLLDRLNKSATSIWTEELIEIICRASTLTVFSNFPMGLLRLPGDTSPLSSRVPITYRSLIPLTRTVQTELMSSSLLGLSGKVKILLTECIPPSDPVGRASRKGWIEIKKLLDSQGSPLQFEIAETSTVDALRNSIREYAPQILIVSAHGAYGERDNAVGIVVGEELCLGDGLWPLPPVVMLSACHVAPRGAGSVSITELLLREGAESVLGTQVPVNVYHNAMLMGRFLSCIGQELSESMGYENLLDLWHYVQSTNAMNDVLSGNAVLQKWAMAQTSRGLSVLEDFMLFRSAGKLRLGHIYRDTEAVLRELASEEGPWSDLAGKIQPASYVPESLFYVFAGRPERIKLRSLLED